MSVQEVERTTEDKLMRIIALATAVAQDEEQPEHTRRACDAIGTAAIVALGDLRCGPMEDAAA